MEEIVNNTEITEKKEKMRKFWYSR
jgi:hypothetical protein